MYRAPSIAIRLLPVALAASLAGCLSTAPTVNSGSATVATGGAGGATAAGANGQLERCNAPLGVVRIDENTNTDWYRHYYGRLGSTQPLLRLMVQQSNCFVIVERGGGLQGIDDETRRGRGEEARESATRGKGQQVTADYLLRPEILMNNRGSSGAAVAARNVLGGVLGKATSLMGSGSTNEAGTALTLLDIRSTVQLAAAEGYSKNTDFGIAGALFSRSSAVSGTAYGRTDEGKVVAAAFMDAYNKLVVAVRSYKAQTVKGGLGEGGTLGVQGGSTAAGKAVR
jgi:hypothetical protein